MYDEFLDRINQSYSNQLYTWQVARWLNVAQEALFKRYYYNMQQKASNSSTPPNTMEDSVMTTDLFAPFKRKQVQPTDVKGFVAFSALGEVYAHITDVLLEKPAGDCSSDRWVGAKLMVEEQYSAVQGDVFAAPYWNQPKRITRYNPWYVFENAGANSLTGIRIIPEGQYTVQVRYLVMPSAIAIQNSAYDADDSAYVGYVTTPADIDSRFPVTMHKEIVAEAVSQFLKSVSDPQNAAIMDGVINTGRI